MCLYLPRHYGEADAEDAAPASSDGPRAEQGETVLVVDDEPTVRMLVHRGAGGTRLHRHRGGGRPVAG